MNLSKIFVVVCLIGGLAISAFGADRALVIGVEHYKDESKCNEAMDNLNEGCVTPTFGGIADAVSMEKLLQTKFGFARGAIRTLTEKQATAANIRDSFQNWLIAGTNPGDRVFVFYSGHGARIPDNNNDEDDGKDEVIAPFDVQTIPKLTNIILDDEINQWIAALSGRQVIMVFDSCHSGTISRTLGSKSAKFSKYLITENLAERTAKTARTRSMTDEFSAVPPVGKTRDLSTVVDKYLDKKTPNVVVVSASQAYQQAMWFDANGSICGANPPSVNNRGALTYLFEKVYETKNPTLAELDRELKKGMAALGKEGTNQLCPADTGYQVPVVEFGKENANQTLAATTWTQSPIVALLNPLSEIKLELNVKAPNNTYRIGEDINYAVTVSEDVFIYVVVFSEKDVATVIFPNADNKQNFFTKGTINLPTAEAAEPLGKDVWITIASKKRISGLENVPAGEEFKWCEVYAKINVKELQTNLENVVRTRGVTAGSKLQISDWQTASAVMTTLPKK